MGGVLPEPWSSQFKRVVGEQGARISELTAENEELLYACAGVSAIVADRFADDIREGEGPMDVAERLLEELSVLRGENQLLARRLSELEKELETLRAPK